MGSTSDIESRHATLTAAQRDIERGWIPRFLPASTVHIHETHDLDRNTGHGTFAFGAADAAAFRAALTELPSGEIIHSIDLPLARLKREGYLFYRQANFYLAIGWPRQRGGFWLAHRQ